MSLLLVIVYTLRKEPGRSVSLDLVTLHQGLAR